MDINLKIPPPNFLNSCINFERILSPSPHTIYLCTQIAVPIFVSDFPSMELYICI